MASVTRLLRRAATLLGMTVPRPDPKIPDLVSASEAGRILGLHKNAVILRARSGRLMAARIDHTGSWVFRRSHIEWVAELEHRKTTSVDPEDET